MLIGVAVPFVSIPNMAGRWEWQQMLSAVFGYCWFNKLSRNAIQLLTGLPIDFTIVKEEFQIMAGIKYVLFDLFNLLEGSFDILIREEFTMCKLLALCMSIVHE